MSKIAEDKITQDWPKSKPAPRSVDRYALMRAISAMLDDMSPEGEAALQKTTLADIMHNAAAHAAALALRAKRAAIMAGYAEATCGRHGHGLSIEQSHSAIGQLEIAYEIYQASIPGALSLRSLLPFARPTLLRLAELGIVDRKSTVDNDGEYYLINESTWPWLRLAAETTNDFNEPI